MKMRQREETMTTTSKYNIEGCLNIKTKRKNGIYTF